MTCSLYFYPLLLQFVAITLKPDNNNNNPKNMDPISMESILNLCMLESFTSAHSPDESKHHVPNMVIN